MGAIYLGQKCKTVSESLFVMPAFLQQHVRSKTAFCKILMMYWVYS